MQQLSAGAPGCSPAQPTRASVDFLILLLDLRCRRDRIKGSFFMDDPKSKIRIVGIGASAGGLEALKEFFSHIPPDSGLAFVVIQHLDPNHASYTADLLSRQTR